MDTGPDPAPQLEPLPAPVVIPRAEHPISRKNIDREALKVLYRLRDAGYTAYLVGGGVRDLFLGKTPKDFDISTNARPGELRKLFRNSRIIGKRFRLVQIFYPGNKIIEVSTFRCRSEYDINGGQEVLASNNTFGTPAEDACRRDLTINGLFYEIENYTVIDYVNGVADLKKGIIRMVGDPDRRIRRDPVRMMRVIRHAARCGFTVEEKTWKAIKEHRDKLKLCPVSRIRDELFKDLLGGASRPWAELAIKSGLFPIIFPCYEELLISAEDEPCRQQVINLHGVVDRLQSENQRLPDHMLFALLLVPWAEKALALMTVRHGSELHSFPRLVRSAVDQALEHMSLKRAIREEITMLLSNLPIFVTRFKEGTMPKSMKRKSYYPTCLQFYRIYEEAQGGSKVEQLDVKHPEKTAAQPKKRSAKRANRTPAFATNVKGGIFGFKR